MAEYRQELISRYWTYAPNFPTTFFEQPFAPDGRRPPVFHKHEERKNVITRPGAAPTEIDGLFKLLPEGERHKWFRSMNSSQALAQSTLGNLAIYGQLDCLAELSDDAGLPLLGEAQVSFENLVLEYKVDYLGEPRSTRLDGFISGKYQVAIECKFTEAEVGSCSRPRLTPSDSNYAADWCNGDYTAQLGRKARCPLTSRGVLYWKYIPRLFNWQNDRDHESCPVYKNYQLVRNILAVCVQPDGGVSTENGHAVLIYDERNPAFQKGGDGLVAFEETLRALKATRLLRKCSWQRIIMHLRNKTILPWLTEQLESKYGL